MAPVNISVRSNNSGVNDHFNLVGILTVADTTLTWRAAFENTLLVFLRDQCVSDASKKFMATLEDKVEDLINQFEHPMDPYIIHVDEWNAETRAKYAPKAKEANDKKRTVGLQNFRTRVRIVRRQTDLGEGSSGPKSPQFETINFSKGGPGFPNNAESPEVAHDLNGEIDDTASMLSQDSQDGQDNGEGVKASVVRKLMQHISNGDLAVIKKEFLKMKADGKNTMTVARHIPTVVNFLDVLFANQPNAD